MKPSILPFFGFIAGGWLAVTASSSAATVFAHAADASVSSTGVISRLNDTAVTVGFEATLARSAVLVFQLPTLAPGESITAASLGVRVVKQGAPTFNFDLYGLGFRTSPDVVDGDYFSGTLDTTDATLLADSFFTPSTADGTRTFNGAALTAYLNDQILAGAGGNYIFIRASADVVPESGASFYYLGSDTNTTYIPRLTFTVVPEPGSALLAGVGMFAVLLRRRTR